MKVKSNAERLIAYTQDQVLSPGLNDVADADWASLSSHPHIKALLDSKVLEVMADAPAVVVDAVEDKPKKKK